MRDRQDAVPRPRPPPLVLPQRYAEVEEVAKMALPKMETLVFHADLEDTVDVLRGPQEL